MTVEEIKQKYGNDFFNKIWQPTQIIVSPKPVITTFEDFDSETQNIYIKISQIIKTYNPVISDINVYATGSRVLGTWKNKEELIAYTEANLLPETVKPIYEFYTDANFPPIQEIFLQFLTDITVIPNSIGPKILIP